MLKNNHFALRVSLKTFLLYYYHYVRSVKINKECFKYNLYFTDIKDPESKKDKK